MSELKTKVLRSMNTLPEQQQHEVLRFIEYLQTRENASFIAYVNAQTRQAVEAKQRGEHFTSLAELQQEYAQTV